MAGSVRENGRRKEDRDKNEERHKEKVSAQAIGAHLALNVSPSRRIHFVTGSDYGGYSTEEAMHVFGNGESHDSTHEIGAHGMYPPGFVLLNGKGDSDDDDDNDDVPRSNGVNQQQQQRSSRHVKSGAHVDGDEERDGGGRIDTDERDSGEYPVSIDLDWKDVRKVNTTL